MARVIFLLTEEKIFQKSTNQKQELPVVAMFINGSGRNEHSLQRTCHRCCLPSFGSFGQAVSEEKILKNRPIRNKNCLWWPYLLMDWDEMSNLQRGPSIDASYQVSLHLAEGFQRRRLKCEKLTDDIRWTPSDGKSSHCLWEGELKIKKTTSCITQIYVRQFQKQGLIRVKKKFLSLHLSPLIFPTRYCQSYYPQ